MNEVKAAEDLPDLSEMQMAFVFGLLEGKTAVDAYTDAGYGEGSTRASLICNASQLKTNPKIQQYLNYFKGLDIVKGARTKEQHVRELQKLRDEARADKQYGPAVNAEVKIGQAMGHYVEKVEVQHKTPERILEEIAKDLGDDFALQVAKSKGIEWTPGTILS